MNLVPGPSQRHNGRAQRRAKPVRWSALLCRTSSIVARSTIRFLRFGHEPASLQCPSKLVFRERTDRGAFGPAEDDVVTQASGERDYRGGAQTRRHAWRDRTGQQYRPGEGEQRPPTTGGVAVVLLSPGSGAAVSCGEHNLVQRLVIRHTNRDGHECASRHGRPSEKSRYRTNRRPSR